MNCMHSANCNFAPGSVGQRSMWQFVRMFRLSNGARAGWSSHRSCSVNHKTLSIPTCVFSQRSQAQLTVNNDRFSRFRSGAAALEAEAAPKEAAKAKPVMDLPTSEESEELLRIRHSVRPCHTDKDVVWDSWKHNNLLGNVSFSTASALHYPPGCGPGEVSNCCCIVLEDRLSGKLVGNHYVWAGHHWVGRGGPLPPGYGTEVYPL